MTAMGVETVTATSWLYAPRLPLNQFRVPENGHLINTYRTQDNISAFQPVPRRLIERLTFL